MSVLAIVDMFSPFRSIDRLSSPSIVIEPLLQRGKLRWQVRMGRRSLIFHQEQAARAFAAQLHMRLLWLQQSASPDDGFAPLGTPH
jgi:hypothetical protein